MHQIKKFDLHQLADAIAYFAENGYVVFRDAFSAQQGEAFWADVERHIAGNEKLTYSLYGQLYEGTNVPLDGKKLPRIIDMESHSPLSRAMALAPSITAFLRVLYGSPPICLQTLTYKYSSEQAAHSDKTLVAPPYAHDYDRETLAASWLALEPANESNGALVIYPGSHKLPKRGYTDGFDGDYGRYTDYLHEWLEANGFAPVSFIAERGDVLFWQGDFVHAGGRIALANGPVPTRKSLVCHYARVPSWVPSRDPGWLKRPAHGGGYFQKREHLGF